MLLRVAPFVLLAVMLSYASSAINALSTQGTVPCMQFILNYFCFCVLVLVFVIQLSLFRLAYLTAPNIYFYFTWFYLQEYSSPVISSWL